MDDNIYNYKEKMKKLNNNQMTFKKQRNPFKKDILLYKTSTKNTDRSLKMKTNRFNQQNKYDSSNYRTLNQFRSNKTKEKELKLNKKQNFLKNKLNNDINSFKYKNKSKPSKIKTKILLTEPDKLEKSNSNLKHSTNADNKKNKIKKDILELPLVSNLNNKNNTENNILHDNDPEIESEYKKLKKIWEETGVTKTFKRNFEIINNNMNNDNKEDILQIIKAEINQMSQFKNEIN